MRKPNEPVFTVKLEHGMADRHRMPIEQVIGVLSEVRQMLTEAGRAIQQERGMDSPPLDFGLEIVAGADRNAFHKGSLGARIAITNNIDIGIAAAARVIETVHALGATRKKAASTALPFEPDRAANILSRLDRIAYVHERSKVDTKFSVLVPRGYQGPSLPKGKRQEATLGRVAVQRLVAMREPVFSEENVVLYGKLVELKDRTHLEKEGGKFWGELRRDNGDTWRIQFSGEAEGQAVPLFRQQVTIRGTAHYFQSRAPKLIAEEIVADEQRDYLKAFDELFAINRDIYKADLSILLGRRYGDE